MEGGGEERCRDWEDPDTLSESLVLQQGVSVCESGEGGTDSFAVVFDSAQDVVAREVGEGRGFGIARMEAVERCELLGGSWGRSGVRGSATVEVC